MRGEPALGFDGGEVLQVIAGEAAQVLDEPVEQRGEVQRVPGGAGVVVGVRVGGCSVLADPAVRRAGQRDEQRRPEGLAVRRGVGLADRPGVDRAAGQGSGVLAAPGGAVAAWPRRQDLATKPGIGDRLVKLADPLIQLSRIEAFAGQEVPAFLRLGPVGDQRPLVLGSRVRVDDGFVVQVPAFAALRGPQDPGPLGARRAHRGQGVPARDEDLLDVAGVDLGPAQLHRPQAGAVLGGQLLHHVPGQRHRPSARPASSARAVTRHRPSRCRRCRTARRSRTGGIRPAAPARRCRPGPARSGRRGRVRRCARRFPS